MQDLSVLTPPLLMCAVVVIAIIAFLRHEMGKKAGDESQDSDDNTPVQPISGRQADDEPTASGHRHQSRED